MAKRASAKMKMTDATTRGQPTGPLVDSLTNLVSGMGTDKDKLTHTVFGASLFNAAQLENAYRGDWIARKVVDLPSKDATREWRAWQADKDQITAIENIEKRFNLQQKLTQSIIKARLYGGGAIVMGVNQGESNEELIVDKLGKDCIKFLHTLSMNELTAGPTIWDVNSPWFGEPEYYTLAVRDASSQNVGSRIHPSRVVRFVGREMPDLSRNVNNGWGDSVLQSVGDAIIQVGTVTNGFAQLVQEAKLDVISIPDLTANLSNADYEGKLRNRFAIASQTKSIYSLLLLDKAEEWQRMEINFTGMPDMVKAYLLIASGAADIPATRMLSQSPTGLSATGESDLRNYYDAVAVDQKTEYGPRLSRLDEVLIRSALGVRPEEIFYNWNPLWQMDEKQKAEISKSKADTYKIDVDTGLINPDVLREARINQLIEDGTYPGLEGLVDEYGSEDEDDTDEGTNTLPAMIPDPNDPTKMIPNPALAKSTEPAPVTPPDDGNKPDDANEVDEVPPKTITRDTASAILDMTRRVRLADATPRSLYVRRNVVNADEIIAWAKSVGFETTYPAEELHVTIAYSRLPVDWMKFNADWGGQNDKGEITIEPGGARLIEKLGDEVAVLMFTSSALTWRWREFKEGGCDWSYPDYQPHITITQTWRDAYAKFEPYRGKIVLGPEIFEEVKPKAMEGIVEK